MREVIDYIDAWQQSGLALATVVQTWGSSPRGVGAKMLITNDRKIAGSVSGGCVEGAVIEEGLKAIKSGKPRLLHFGVADETAWDVGLACGGTVDIFVKPLDFTRLADVKAAILEQRTIAIVTIVRGADDLIGQELVIDEEGQILSDQHSPLESAMLVAGRTGLETGVSHTVELAESAAEALVDVIMPAPTLVMVGGAHISITLVTIAKTLGFHTILVDPRKVFGSEERFPHVDELIQAWPDKAFEQIGLTRSTAIATLTHDPKLDDPALMLALASPAFYVGALGSRRTHEKRLLRLREEGVSEENLARVHAPIGLEIDASTPEEIALAIMAEVVRVSHNRTVPKPRIQPINESRS